MKREEEEEELDLTYLNDKDVQFDIYPNPVTDILFIKNHESISKVNIYDLSGKQVRSFTNNISQIKVGGLPSGQYFLLLHTVDGIMISKHFVKS